MNATDVPSPQPTPLWNLTVSLPLGFDDTRASHAPGLDFAYVVLAAGALLVGCVLWTVYCHGIDGLEPEERYADVGDSDSSDEGAEADDGGSDGGGGGGGGSGQDRESYYDGVSIELSERPGGEPEDGEDERRGLVDEAL